MSNTGENIYERRDGRWEGRYICGRKPDGRAQYVSVYGRSCSDVRNKIRERLRACTPEPAPRSAGTSVLTVNQLFESILSHADVKPSEGVSHLHGCAEYAAAVIQAKACARLFRSGSAADSNGDSGRAKSKKYRHFSGLVRWDADWRDMCAEGIRYRLFSRYDRHFTRRAAGSDRQENRIAGANTEKRRFGARDPAPIGLALLSENRSPRLA